MSEKYHYDDKARVLTIYANGVYTIGPQGEEIMMVIQVGEENGGKAVSKEGGSEVK